MTLPDQSYSWTQPTCDDCWDRDHPGSPSPRADAGEYELCCFCGTGTRSGIYVRVDPESVDHPTLLSG